MDKRLRFMTGLIAPLRVPPGSEVKLNRDHDPWSGVAGALAGALSAWTSSGRPSRAGQGAGVGRLDGRDHAARHADGQRALGFRGVASDGAGSADEQVDALDHDLDIKL
jgi:hypothetical protein